MMKRAVFALPALVLAAACATATPYAPAGAPNARGFSEQRIETNRFIVSFAGNSLTDRRTVETYLLFRAAELASQNGADWFEVIKRDTDAQTSYLPTDFGSPFYAGWGCSYTYYGPRGRLWRAYDPFWDPWGMDAGYREIVRYEASAEILLGRGSRPAGAQYFSTQEVLENLSGTIRRPEA